MPNDCRIIISLKNIRDYLLLKLKKFKSTQMKSQKQNLNSESKEGPIITEEDRSNNPIFKIIYKRVRNLTKKVTHINALLEQDQSTLKPEQLQKI